MKVNDVVVVGEADDFVVDVGLVLVVVVLLVVVIVELVDVIV